MRMVLVVLGMAWVTASGLAMSAENPVGGRAIVEVGDGTTERGCIDISRNVVSINLVAAQIARNQKWWDKLRHKHDALGLKFDVSISDGTSSFVFPRAKNVRDPGISSDIGLLALRFPLMIKYSLSDAGKKPYKNIQIDIFLVTIDKASTVLKALIDFTKDVQLPPSPFATGMGLFGGFANRIVQSDLGDGVGTEPDASVSFDLAGNIEEAQSPNCIDMKRSGLRVGTLAIISDYTGKAAGNFVAVSDAGNYCYWFDSAAGRIRYAQRQSGKQLCESTFPADSKLLDNPLVALAVTRWPITSASTMGEQKSLADVINSADSFPAVEEKDLRNVLKDAQGNVALRNERVDLKLISDVLAHRSVAAGDREKLRDLAGRISPADAAAVVAVQRCNFLKIPLSDCK